jgi:hypothetical protein
VASRGRDRVHHRCPTEQSRALVARRGNLVSARLWSFGSRADRACSGLPRQEPKIRTLGRLKADNCFRDRAETPAMPPPRLPLLAEPCPWNIGTSSVCRNELTRISGRVVSRPSSRSAQISNRRSSVLCLRSVALVGVVMRRREWRRCNCGSPPQLHLAAGTRCSRGACAPAIPGAKDGARGSGSGDRSRARDEFSPGCGLNGQWVIRPRRIAIP